MLLNTADKVYLGAVAADRVYLGANLVWQPAVAPAGPTASILTSYTPGTDRNDFTGEVGVRLGIGSTPLTVSWVGLRCNGYGGTRTVKIYEWFSSAVVATVTIDYTGKAVGEYAWTAITPLTLGANGYYAVLMVCTAGDGQVWKNPGPVTMSSHIVNIYDSYYSGGLLTGLQNSSFVGVDLGWNAGENPARATLLPGLRPPPEERP